MDLLPDEPVLEEGLPVVEERLRVFLGELQGHLALGHLEIGKEKSS